jgi:hypothetical protein
MAKLLSATLALSVFAISERASARAEKTTIAAKPRSLFKCRTDQLFMLRPLRDGASEPGYAVSARRGTKGQISLIMDADSHAMTLFLRSRGGARKAYVLSNVEQGSSPGSGTGGRADTIIRGASAGKVFTLFAGYENNGLGHDAALLVAGRVTLFLTCGEPQYSDPSVKGVGRYGSTNIYVLSGDGLAREMKTLPVEPDIQRALEASRSGRAPRLEALASFHLTPRSVSARFGPVPSGRRDP